MNIGTTPWPAGNNAITIPGPGGYWITSLPVAGKKLWQGNSFSSFQPGKPIAFSFDLR